VVLCGFETLSLTLREEHRLRAFENRVMRKICRLTWDELAGGWRKQHKEELCNLYTLPSIISIMKSRRMRRVEHVAQMEEKREAYRLLIGLAQDRDQWRALMKVVMNLWFHRMLRSSREAAQPVAFQVVLSSIQFVH
jgi:hypothetical protein